MYSCNNMKKEDGTIVSAFFFHIFKVNIFITVSAHISVTTTCNFIENRQNLFTFAIIIG